LAEKETTCSTGKKESAETIHSRKVSAETIVQCASDSSIASAGKVKMLSVSTSTCVEMLDAAVGVDKVAKPFCHVSVQTCNVTSNRIVSQTDITDSRAAQMDYVTLPHADNCTSHPEDRLANCKLLEEKTTCTVGRNQNTETKLCRKVATDAAIRTKCLSDSGVLNNGNLNSYGVLSKDIEREGSISVALKQKCMEIKSKTQSTMIRCDYEKPENCLREEVKKYNESSVPEPTAQSSTNKLLTQQNVPPADKRLTQQITPSADKLLMQDIVPASSGLFAVEGTPYSSSYCKKIYPDEWLMPVVPCCHHHVGPLLFQPKLMRHKLAVSSMAKLSKKCCHKNAVTGAYPSMNHHCVSQTARTNQELRNFCCCLCGNTHHSNHEPQERKKGMKISCMRSSSDKKSVKQAWKRIMDTEDSCDGSETRDNHKMPSSKMFHKRLRINSTSSTETDSDIENTGLRRRGIYAEKQGSCVDIGPGRKMARKQLRKRGNVAHINGRYCQNGMDERKKYRTARSGKINACLKESHLHAGSSSDNQQHNNICCRFQRRKNKHNENHKKDHKECISGRKVDKNFPLLKLKHRSKCQMYGQLNEHIDNSATSATKVCGEFHIDQPDENEFMKNCETESCSAEKTNLRSDMLQKTEAVTEEDTHKRLSCIDLFGNTSDISLDDEQQSGRIAAHRQNVQPGKVTGSSPNKHKRKAGVENRSMDCGSFETQNSKRTKMDFINKENNDSATNKDYETVSNILLHSVSESDPEKYLGRTCKASTGITLSSGEQTHVDQDCNISTAHESSLMPELQVSAYKTGQATSKTDVSQRACPRRKPSKLEKLRRNLIRAKRPSKIATDLPIKIVKGRKTLTPRCEASCVGSESLRPGVKNIPEMVREYETPNSISITSNLLEGPSHQGIPARILENEKPPRKHDTTTHSMVNCLVNNHDNSVVDHTFSFNTVMGQICSSTYVTKESVTETNDAVDISESFASKDNVPDTEISIVPISSCVTETVSPVPRSEIQTDSHLTEKTPEKVKIIARPISYQENISEASQISENVGLVTLPHTYVEASTRPETVSEVCSQNLPPKTCQTTVDFKDIKSAATVPQTDELEDIICLNFSQESLPSPVSPIKDPVRGEPQPNSKANESLTSTQDTVQVAELPVAKLSIDSQDNLTGSSMCIQTGKQITVKKSTATKNTDENLFAGCVLQWVLRDYEVEYKKKHPKKSKSMTAQHKGKG
jgi:hypothetical protein